MSSLPPIRIPTYSHFDATILRTELESIVASSQRVASHPFLPLLSYTQRWKPFVAKGKPPKKAKSRVIRYAARRDSYLFAYYRRLLVPLYEDRLVQYGLEHNVLAYRKIPAAISGKNKSNVCFAREAFDAIRAMGECYAISLDISKFFDSIDHLNLKLAWAGLLGGYELPDDHYAVFKAVTRYDYVDKQEAFEAIGIIGKKIDASGKTTIGYTKSKKEILAKLCDNKVFHEKIKPLVKTNKDNFGIPQGLPISDVLSNLSLLEFDRAAKQIISKVNGLYYRYSDDILVLIPGLSADYAALEATLMKLIKKSGTKLEIQPTKCAVHRFKFDLNSNLVVDRVAPSPAQTKLDYLGFTFDGRKMFVKSGTLSRLQRRTLHSIRNHAKKLVAANPNLTLAQLKPKFNTGLIISRFGKKPKDKKASTFYSYAKRSTNQSKSLDNLALKQLRKQKRNIEIRASLELATAFQKFHS